MARHKPNHCPDGYEEWTRSRALLYWIGRKWLFLFTAFLSLWLLLSPSYGFAPGKEAMYETNVRMIWVGHSFLTMLFLALFPSYVLYKEYRALGPIPSLGHYVRGIFREYNLLAIVGGFVMATATVFFSVYLVRRFIL
jgi:hypothetical protein